MNLFEHWPRTHYIALVYTAVEEYLSLRPEHSGNRPLTTPMGEQLRDIRDQALAEYKKRDGQ